VRPFEPRDLPAVTALYRRMFPRRVVETRGAAVAVLEEVLLRSPWNDPARPSLLLEDASGEARGFLGVLSRPMGLGARPLRVAITHTFMVEPDSRAGLAALALAQGLLEQEHDLTLAEGGAASRRILERLGGTLSLPLSLRWTRPLRPGRWLLSFLGRHGLPRPLSLLLAPAARVADLVGARLARPAPAGHLAAGPLSHDALLEALAAEARPGRLAPVYDRASLGWILDLLNAQGDRGALRRVALRTPDGVLRGFYLYYLRPGGISEVVRVGAQPAFLGDVIDHLFDDAWRGGAAAVSGQLDPEAFQDLASRGVAFHNDGASWFLMHSRHAEILDAVHRGDARLTRLEGEWAIRP
jgi:hypothetical protein